jgi:hypothetical protein
MAKRRVSTASGFRLTAPSKPLFFISVAIAALALISLIVFIPNITAYAAWLALLAYLVLAAGVALTGI